MNLHTGAVVADTNQALSDEDLVASTLSGDVGAFNDLVHRWEGSLYKFVYRYLGDAEEARDICQEAFVRAYTNLDRFRGQAKFSSWLYQIALNLARSLILIQVPAQVANIRKQQQVNKISHQFSPASKAIPLSTRSGS